MGGNLLYLSKIRIFAPAFPTEMPTINSYTDETFLTAADPDLLAPDDAR